VWIAGAMNVVFLGVVGLALLAFAPAVVGIFAGVGAARGIAIEGLRVVSLGFVFYAFGMVMTQSFNGAGDTRTPTLLNFLCFWCCEIPLAWLLARHLDMGPNGVFVAITLAFSVFAVAAVTLFRRGRWKRVVV
jgi:Na+-driven multidrug efflux pump